MIVQTTPGDTYAITATIPCTVHAVRGKEAPVLVLTIEASGQYLVVAPTTALDISDPAALVTKSFKSAPAGFPVRAVSGGGDIGTETVEQPLVPDGPQDNLNTCGFTFRVEQGGTLKTIALKGRRGYEFHKNPLWLKIWKTAAAAHTWLGLSQNSVVQINEQINTWNFDSGITLTAGDLVTITSHREESRESKDYAVETTDGKLLSRVAPIAHQDGIGCLDDYGIPGWNFLPVGIITLSKPANLADYAQISILDETTFNPAQTRAQTLYILQTQTSSTPSPDTPPQTIK